jgi:peptide/nickel transport system substrate-binding protein
MNCKHLLAASLCSSILTFAGCGGGSPPATSAPGSPAAASIVEPPAGVPPSQRPLPLPERGVAYTNPQPRENIKDGGTLTLPIVELGPNFNTFSVDGHSAYMDRIYSWIAPKPWIYSVTGGVTPNKDYLLSAELVNENPETVKFTLNPDAKWNDGTPIDWTAFEVTWKTQSGDDRYNPATTVGYSSIASVAKGEKANEVIVTFKEPFYPFEYLFQDLAHPKLADPAFFKTGWVRDLHPELLAGPFTVDSLSEQRLVLKRNPKWWGEPAKLDQVVYIQMEDQAEINAFHNGELDSASIYTADRLTQVSGMEHVQLRRGFAATTFVYTMGRDSALFKDAAARRAFALGTDRELLVKIRYQGMDWKEEPPGSVLMFPWQDGFQDNIADLHYDPKAAAKVLDDAGWKLGSDGYRYKDGKIAEFKYVTFGDDPLFAALARAQQKMSQEIGLKMQIDTRKSSDYSPTMTKGDYDVVIMGWTSSDPFGYVEACQLFCSDSESNYSRLGNRALDERLNRVGAIADQARAIAAANDAEAEALHLLGTFPLFNGPEQFAVKEGLANFGPAAFATPVRKNVGWQK